MLAFRQRRFLFNYFLLQHTAVMSTACIPDDDPISTTDYTDDPVTEVSEVSTPVTFSADASPQLSEQPLPLDLATATQKKKKKKKSKKSAKAKEAATASASTPSPSKPRSPDADGNSEDRPQVLCISRNKHWRYISSYHVRLLARVVIAGHSIYLRVPGYNFPSNSWNPFSFSTSTLLCIPSHLALPILFPHPLSDHLTDSAPLLISKIIHPRNLLTT